MGDKRGGPPVPHGAPPTLLRSLAVTPSSSRQGSLCTNASIWYLALMNSDLMGLGRAVGRRVGEAGHPATSRIRVPGHAVPATTPPAQLTGLCLGGWPCAGHSALARGPAGSAPRWSWPRCWRVCAPSAGRGAKSEGPLRTGYGGNTSTRWPQPAWLETGPWGLPCPCRHHTATQSGRPSTRVPCGTSGHTASVPRLREVKRPA